jgi:large subunit ribosomal protein L4
MAETNNFQAAAYTARGTERDPVELPGSLFDGTVNVPVMHQAVKAFLANQRQGNASTKIRKYVVGGNQKPWKQKGTGRARQGSTRAPHWVGGGTVFGPLPRSYAEYVPRQVRALARKSALNARARENAIFVIDTFAYDAPKTSQMRALVERLGVGDQKVLILTDGSKPNVFLSGRNLPNVHVMPYGDVSTYHILWSDVVLIEAGALGQTLEPVAEREPAEAPKRKRPVTKKTAKRRAAALASETDDGGDTGEVPGGPGGTPPVSGGRSLRKKPGKGTPAKKKSAAKKAPAKKAAKKKSAAKSAKKSSTRKKGK